MAAFIEVGIVTHGNQELLSTSWRAKSASEVLDNLNKILCAATVVWPELQIYDIMRIPSEKKND